jgi:hypothetical protein
MIDESIQQSEWPHLSTVNRRGRSHLLSEGCSAVFLQIALVYPTYRVFAVDVLFSFRAVKAHSGPLLRNHVVAYLRQAARQRVD